MLHQKFRETLPCPLAARRFENSIVFVEAVIDNPERLHGREERANFELSDDDGLFNFELTLPHERGAPEACLAASPVASAMTLAQSSSERKSENRTGVPSITILYMRNSSIYRRTLRNRMA